MTERYVTLFWEQSDRRGRKQLLHERSDVENELRGLQDGIHVRVRVSMCVDIDWQASDSWRNREDIKEIGRGARDTHVNRICPIDTNIRMLLRYAAFGISNPAVLLRPCIPLASENRVYPGIAVPLKILVWWNSDSAERPALLAIGVYFSRSACLKIARAQET